MLNKHLVIECSKFAVMCQTSRRLGIALGTDRRFCESVEAPRGAGFVDDIVVAFEHGDSEFVAAQIFPDILERVQLWSVGRQADERDVAWNGESRRDMIACAIDDERSMRSRRDTVADFGQMHGHCIGIGGG
jgi:hypothetical protein